MSDVLVCSFGWCRDVALYSLGVGACSADAEDEKELQLVYQRNGQSSIKVLTEGYRDDILYLLIIACILISDQNLMILIYNNPQ
jgi:hypothetical protein